MDASRTLTVGEAQVMVLPTPDDVARTAAEITVVALQSALDERGAAHLVLTGGSSAVALYSLLARGEWRDRVSDWEHVHLWFGDERMVPPDHPESNVGLAYRELLSIGAKIAQSSSGEGTDVGAGVTAGLPIPAGNVHAPEILTALATDDPGSFAAESYTETLRQFAPMGPDGNPEFDLVHLGVGPDGHILSVFPGSAGLAPAAPLVMPVEAPEHVGPHIRRVTLTPRILPPAHRVLVMATGSTKAKMLADVFGRDREPARLPAQQALRRNATWLIDAAAAAELPA